jgi:hypothetical protein
VLFKAAGAVILNVDVSPKQTVSIQNTGVGGVGLTTNCPIESTDLQLFAFTA